MTPTGSTYLAMEIHGLRQLLAEKDAEIERLKRDIEDWKENERRALSLITELCDALEWYVPLSLTPRDLELIQSARDATK